MSSMVCFTLRETMKKTFAALFFTLAVLGVCAAGCSYEESPQSKSVKRKEAFSHSEKSVIEETVDIETLAKWHFLGFGEVTVDREENAVRCAEYKGSKGVTLLSPDSYNTRYLAISFRVKPETFESVIIVMHSISDTRSGGAILIPENYDGGFEYWTRDVQNYVCAFHNKAHDSVPYICRNPGMNILAKTDTLSVTEGEWHDVQIGRDGPRLWLEVDGTMVVEGTDSESEMLPGGSIAFRLRGTADGVASALFKDVYISLQK